MITRALVTPNDVDSLDDQLSTGRNTVHIYRVRFSRGYAKCLLIPTDLHQRGLPYIIFSEWFREGVKTVQIYQVNSVSSPDMPTYIYFWEQGHQLTHVETKHLSAFTDDDDDNNSNNNSHSNTNNKKDKKHLISYINKQINK